jgi:transposase
MNSGRHEAVLRAARAAFAAGGFADTRVCDIADSAGVSDSLIYRTWGSKTGLYEAAARQPMEETAARIGEIAERIRAAGRLDRYEQSYHAHVDLFAAMEGLVPMLSSAGYGAGTSLKLQEVLSPVLERLRESIGLAMEGWAYEGGDPELVTEVLLGTYHWLAMRACHGALPADIDDLRRRFVTLLMRAVQPRAQPIPFPNPGPAEYELAAPEQAVSERLWAALAPHLPHEAGRGGRWRDHREVLAAIAWRCRTGRSWRQLPREYGSWRTAWTRFDRWQRDGTWERLIAAAEQADEETARDAAWMRVAPGWPKQHPEDRALSDE